MGRAKKKIEKKKNKESLPTASGSATVATNRKAYHDYQLTKEYVAGMVLQGSEVKSLRLGRVQLKGSYAKIIDGEVWLFNCHISEYEHANRFNHDPIRARKLLLHKKEIEKIEMELQLKDATLAVSKIFFQRNRAKAALHIAVGKKQHDKRADLKKKAQQRDIDRAIKKF